MDSFEILQENISQNCFKRHEGQRQIDFLILHHLQANSIAQTVEALEYHQVSAHFLIDKNGSCYAYHPFLIIIRFRLL